MSVFVRHPHAPISFPPVHELRPGLWHWQAPHPEWRESEPWERNVSSYAADDGERLLLFDPIDPPSEIEVLAAGAMRANPNTTRFSS